MDDITRALAAAWKEVRPRLARDEPELRRRLLRRSSALLRSPPRAWCLAVRANDTRLSHSRGLGVPPEHSPTSPDHAKHALTITSDDLSRLCAPVTIPFPGLPLHDVANLLGVTRGSLIMSRLKKVFSVRHVPALNGRWGSPHPILYTDKLLDPATRGFAMPDPLFSFTAPHFRDRIPPDIRATLTRIPIFHDATRAYRDTKDLHPEHPALDRSYDPRRRNRSRALPPPEPDPVWYKWKGDTFVGYDWRAAESNPRIKAGYDRHQRALARYRDYNRNRRQRKSTAGGSLRFRGWSWLCPKCHRPAQVLFHPLPRMALIQLKTLKIPADLKEKLAAAYPRNDFFACQKCHRLRRFSWASKATWGEIVCYLSAGLLYGHEVERPSWFVPKRKNQYAPKPNAKPSRRRPQIERLLLAGHSIAETAAELGLAKGTILFYAKSIYRQHGVRSLRELYLKHHLPLRPGMRGPARRERGTGRVVPKRAKRSLDPLSYLSQFLKNNFKDR